MTKREAAIIGAFTGILVGSFNDLHQYIEEIMERPVFTHELGSKETFERIKELSRPDFIAICESLTDTGVPT